MLLFVQNPPDVTISLSLSLSLDWSRKVFGKAQVKARLFTIQSDGQQSQEGDGQIGVGRIAWLVGHLGGKGDQS